MPCGKTIIRKYKFTRVRAILIGNASDELKRNGRGTQRRAALYLSAACIAASEVRGAHRFYADFQKGEYGFAAVRADDGLHGRPMHAEKISRSCRTGQRRRAASGCMKETSRLRRMLAQIFLQQGLA